jgi:hypothetical protein
MAGGAMSGMPESAAAGDDSLASFQRKWLERWPEWPLAEVFVAPGQREIMLAWAALQQELLDAAWGGSDARPGEAKLAWWSEELHGWSQGRRRHPLGRVLQGRPAPWGALAAGLPALRQSRERPLDADDAFASVEPAAVAAARVDAALSGGDVPNAASVTATWLAWRVLQHGESAVPLALLAGAEQGDPVGRWREALLHHWPTGRSTTRARRLWSTLARLRLAAAPGRAPPSWQVLWAAWRAARN